MSYGAISATRLSIRAEGRHSCIVQRGVTLNTVIVKGRWKRFRGKFRKAWGRLTHDPFMEFGGEWDIVDGKLAEYRERAANFSCMNEQAPGH